MARFVVKDAFFTRAKKEGYRARSAYKLLEIQKKFQIIRKGNRVLDLGCAPGSWLQALSGMVGHEGLVVGIDLLPVVQLAGTHVITRQADIRDLDVAGLMKELAINSFDVITCDIAPNLSGLRDVDNANVANLYAAVTMTAEGGLKKGGNLVLKSFFSEDFKRSLSDLQALFSKVSIYKPTASRSVSSEVYFVCTGKK
jgi:23S rRNA (uridine2552-2'-O)-methyltransferase